MPGGSPELTLACPSPAWPVRTPDERNNPVGLVYVGLASPDGTWCRKLELGKRRRDRIQDLAANHAYDMLRRCLTGLPVEQSGTGKHMEKL